jgi:hypothetical protein
VTTFRPGAVVAGGHDLECGSDGQRDQRQRQGPLRKQAGAIRATLPTPSAPSQVST